MNFRTIPPKVLRKCVWRAVFFLFELFLFCSSTIYYILLRLHTTRPPPSQTVRRRLAAGATHGIYNNCYYYVICLSRRVFPYPPPANTRASIQSSTLFPSPPIFSDCESQSYRVCINDITASRRRRPSPPPVVIRLIHERWFNRPKLPTTFRINRRPYFNYYIGKKLILHFSRTFAELSETLHTATVTDTSLVDAFGETSGQWN